jgi:hypothetical protein
LGDLLDKPVNHGGFAFSRYSASGILVALIIACILFLSQKAGSHPGQGRNPRPEDLCYRSRWIRTGDRFILGKHSMESEQV